MLRFTFLLFLPIRLFRRVSLCCLIQPCLAFSPYRLLALGSCGLHLTAHVQYRRRRFETVARGELVVERLPRGWIPHLDRLCGLARLTDAGQDEL